MLAFQSRPLSRPAGAQRAAIGGSSTSTSSSGMALLRSKRPLQAPCRAIELDFSDPDTQLSVAGVVLGLVMGIGAPVWYVKRTERDEERLEELRAINRATFQETGEYLTDEEIAAIRKPK